ncbi:MAG: hypothetical protein ABTD50_15270 [Polyangiaceae bacterium]|jgi:hypothetical protein
MKPVASKPPSQVVDDPARVTHADLARIDTISSLLVTLNDPRAGADALARHACDIPPLRARISQRFLRSNPGLTRHGLAQQIAILGNRVVEGILLELLEDVVALHSELQSPKR